eukprot:TRINITY_DN705_c0_g3_i2.p1 TRINITY_DN705_c0_g3~~TRINITY_DN705_c0_g3_i2.p1  ORF type:complete len:225 (-),score=39.79 TRINITY_DN705_c0_g3_i2:50-724(-)
MRIGCAQISAETLRAALWHAPHLTDVNMGECAVDRAVCAVVAERLTQLRSLNASWCDRIDDAGVGAVCSSCTRLRRLKLRACTELTTEALCSIVTLLDIRQLFLLDVSRCERVDAGVLQDLPLVSLQSLKLSWCDGVTDAVVASLLRNCVELRELHLVGCKVLSMAALEGLPDLPCATTLHLIDLQYCNDFTESVLQQLVDRCPPTLMIKDYYETPITPHQRKG